MPWNLVYDSWVSWSLYKTTIMRQLKLHETQGSQTKFHGIEYINQIYIYLLSSYNSLILDIPYSPYYIALGSLQTHKVI